MAHLGLLVELHGQTERVEHDGHEYRVLAQGGRGEGPQLIDERQTLETNPRQPV